MIRQPWAKLARVTLAGALLASVIGVSGAPLVAAQNETDCAAIAAGEPQIPEAKDDKFNYSMFEANWLRPLGITEQRYLEYQRQEYLARAMRDVIHAGVVHGFQSGLCPDRPVRLLP